MNTTYIGDKSQFIDRGLDEPDTAPYTCPFCGFEKDVIEEYDLVQRMFFVKSFADTVCDKCGEYMERKGKE